jgi:hypothetical protein
MQAQRRTKGAKGRGAPAAGPESLRKITGWQMLAAVYTAAAADEAAAAAAAPAAGAQLTPTRRSRAPKSRWAQRGRVTGRMVMHIDTAAPRHLLPSRPTAVGPCRAPRAIRQHAAASRMQRRPASARESATPRKPRIDSGSRSLARATTAAIAAAAAAAAMLPSLPTRRPAQPQQATRRSGCRSSKAASTWRPRPPRRPLRHRRGPASG